MGVEQRLFCDGCNKVILFGSKYVEGYLGTFRYIEHGDVVSSEEQAFFFHVGCMDNWSNYMCTSDDPTNHQGNRCPIHEHDTLEDAVNANLDAVGRAIKREVKRG